MLDLLGVAGNVQQHRIDLVTKLLTYHSSLRQNQPVGGISDIFGSAGIFSGARDRFKGLKGVENVYTQHSPRLEMTLHNLIRGRLREQEYPFIDGGNYTRDKAQDIVVFMIGGVTFEEAKTVSQINVSSPGSRVLLGGTTIHNSASFFEELSNATASWQGTTSLTSARAKLQEFRK